jgi:hypothetical protein
MEIGVRIWNVKFDGASDNNTQKNMVTRHEYNKEWRMIASRDERTHDELFAKFRRTHERIIVEFEIDLKESQLWWNKWCEKSYVVVFMSHRMRQISHIERVSQLIRI